VALVAAAAAATCVALLAACGTPAAAKPPAAGASQHDLAAFANDYLTQRATVAQKDAGPKILEGMCLASSGLAQWDIWRARGVASLAARLYHVKDLRISVRPRVRHVIVDRGGGGATVVVFCSTITNRWSDDVTQGYDAVRLVVSGGHWLVTGDATSIVDRRLPQELAAGGAPPDVVAAARRQVRRAARPRPAPGGVVATMRQYCDALNGRRYGEVKSLFTPDSVIRRAPVASRDAQGRTDWRLVRTAVTGQAIPTVCAAWVTLAYHSPLPAGTPGARGARSQEMFELQPDGRWLLFAPGEPAP
jgi:hypothetical protein